MDPDEKEMMDKMGFAKFTAKWQNGKWEEEEVEVKEERPTFRFEVFIADYSSLLQSIVAHRETFSKYSEGVWSATLSSTRRTPTPRMSEV